MTVPHTSDATGAPTLLRYENPPPLRIAGLRQTLKGNPADTIPRMWSRVAAHIDAIAYGVCIHNDVGSACFDYVAGIAVSSKANPPEDWVTLQLPAQRYAVFAHAGHVSALHQTIDAIFSQWLPQSGERIAEPVTGALACIERYGEGFNPRTGSGDIEVWVPLTS